MFSNLGLAAGLVVLAAGAQSPANAPLANADLARLEREATARAQKVAVSGGPTALATEIARELSTIGQYEDFYLTGDYAAAYKNFPAETVTAFKSVDVEIQYNLLLWSWRRFQFPAMVPVLQALYQSPPEDYAKIRDIALRRLFDLDANRARPLMLDELQRKDLRISMTTLSRLGHLTLRDYEGVWLRFLADGILDERADAAVRIEHFGSPAIWSDVKRLYDADASTWSCDVRSSVLGYFYRVNPAVSASMLRGVFEAPTQHGDDCRDYYARSEILRSFLVSRLPPPSAGTPVLVLGPVSGDESRVAYTVGDRTVRSSLELTNWLVGLPSGTTVEWRYATGTAATHPERWTIEERAALLTGIQQAIAPRGITIEPLNP